MTTDAYTLELWVVALIIAALCGFAGTFIVIRRLMFLADTLAHGSLTGIGLGHFFSVAPEMTILPFSVLFSVILTWFSRYRKESIQAVTAVAFSLTVGMGMLILHHSDLDTHELVHVLFGDFSSLKRIDLALIGAFGIPAALYLFVTRKVLLLTFLSEDLALASGMKPHRVHYGFMICIALLMAVSLKLLGVLMVMALVTIPALVSARMSRTFHQQLWLSPLIACICTAVGLFISQHFSVPSGASIATTCGILYVGLSLITRPT